MPPPCPTGCTCRRHTRPRPKCEPGCTCRRHRTFTDAERQRVSKFQRGRVHSDEHNAKISASHAGKKLSQEHIESFKTHGRSDDPNYHRHKAMMARCYNPGNSAYAFYGGRGIGVHEPWHDVTVFCDWVAENLGPCLPGQSLDRINNDRGYEPGNIRWATRSEQIGNRRRIARAGRECVVCGTAFAATRADAKYCSTRCHSTAHRARNRKGR